MAATTTSQRISLTCSAEVKAQLQDLGQSGEAALKQLQSAADAVGKGGGGLGAVSDIVARAKASFNGLGEALAPVGEHLVRLGEASRKLGESLSTVAERLGIGVVASATAASAALFELAKRSAETVRETTESAQQFGLTVPKYQALQLAAATAGIEQEKLNTGLSQFTVSLGKPRRS
jgi:hypothetical protein